MELTILQHVKRVQAGLPIYVAPSADFVPLAYNPLYYFLSVPFTWIFGTSLSTLRLVAILGTLGAGCVMFLAVRQATGSKWWGLIAVGLFAAAYRVMDTYLDNAFPDSWMLFTALLGCYLIGLNRSPTRNLLGVLLTVIAYWFKQPGAAFAVGALLYLTWREGGRKALPAWIMAIVAGPVLYLASATWPFGPEFQYFTQALPRQWIQLDWDNIARVIKLLAKSYLIVAIAGVAAAGIDLIRSRRKISIWYFMLPFALATALPGLLDPESANNLYIPTGIWLIITGMLGLQYVVEHFHWLKRGGFQFVAVGISFALLFYDPVTVILPPQTMAVYQDLIDYLRSLHGTVYAPWIGQLQNSYQFYPGADWVPMDDMVRGPQRNLKNNPDIRRILEPALNPTGNAYLLMPFPLESDTLLDFLTEKYVLDTDLGDRFASLTALPKRYTIGGPRYLYRYDPQAAAPATDSP